VHYECGQVPAAAADLDRAVELAPDLPELYQNRAVALRDLGRFQQAAQDLHTYLELRPDAEDRGEVEKSLSTLAGDRA
jgi:regulator of sirC expression with transglutaminase-like and TPR domain